jgi:hypothetical protein
MIYRYLTKLGRTFFTLCCLFSFYVSSAQGATARIAVYGGGDVEFVFNSIIEYKNGIAAGYVNYTLVGLQVTDAATLPDFTTWKLVAFANNAAGPANTFFFGTNILNKLPFSDVELRATVAANCGTCVVNPLGFIDLVGAPAEASLVTGSIVGGSAVVANVPPNLVSTLDQINISYRCGVGAAKNVMGIPADYYSDDIVLLLEIDP